MLNRLAPDLNFVFAGSQRERERGLDPERPVIA